MTLKEYLLSKGYDFEPEHLDGQPHEFKTATQKGWYIGSQTSRGCVLTWGDWRTGEKFSTSVGWSGSDRERTEELAALGSTYLEKRKKSFQSSALRAKREWEETQSIGPSPYLDGKGLANLGLFGAKTTPNQWGTCDLLIPMRDKNGVIKNLQRIQPDGFKTFMPGAPTEGLRYELPSLGLGPMYFVEGFATACSLHSAITCGQVICCFSSGNLADVIKTYERDPRRAVLAADNDWAKEQNTGLSVALGILNSGILGPNSGVTWPVFDGTNPKHTDWNDLHCQAGLSEVERQVLIDRTPELLPTKIPENTQKETNVQVPSNEIHEPRNNQSKKPGDLGIHGTGALALEPMGKPSGEIVEIETKKQKVLDERDIADKIVEQIGADLICSGGDPADIFRWTGTYWKWLKPAEVNQIMLLLVYASEGKYKFATIRNSTIKLFASKLPQVMRLPRGASKEEKTIHTPDPYKINLKNGTFHIMGDHGSYRMEFKPHSREDYCTNIIPIDYEPGAVNQDFLNMLDKVTGRESKDKHEKFRAIQQMYGACLAPIFPHLFMLHGEAATGKSSTIEPLQYLIHEENTCCLAPSELKKGAELQDVIGKLVNIDPDIPTNELIREDMIKKIRERAPVTINRKFKDPVKAPLPAVNVFGGNGIPQTVDKGTGAMDRRWTFIHCDNKVVSNNGADGGYMLNFSHWVFNQSPSGLLNFALEGLKDLLDNNGHYFKPQSSQRTVAEWTGENDRVLNFIKDIDALEVANIRLDVNGKAPMNSVWESFGDWHDKAHHSKPKMSKIKFFKDLFRAEHKLDVDESGVARRVVLERDRSNISKCVKGLTLISEPKM